MSYNSESQIVSKTDKSSAQSEDVIVDYFFAITKKGKLVVKCKWSQEFEKNIITPLSHKGTPGKSLDELFQETAKEYFGNRDLNYMREEGKSFECEGRRFVVYIVQGIDTVNGNVCLVDVNKLKNMKVGDTINISGKSDKYGILPSFARALKLVFPN